MQMNKNGSARRVFYEVFAREEAFKRIIKSAELDLRSAMRLDFNKRRPVNPKVPIVSNFAVQTEVKL